MPTSPSKPRPLDRELVRKAPKVALHEHLDGSLRPRTILDLADRIGYADLPSREEKPLADWFAAGAARGSLPQYLEGFRHTIALLQTAESLERVAYEYAEDLAKDGVVYGEVRFAPHFHTAGGLGVDAVMAAVLKGLARGREDFGVEIGLIVLRDAEPLVDALLADGGARRRVAVEGCVGFDLAGEEAGHPARHHLDAFQLVKRMNFSITIHAGESFGPESIWQALQYCGAHRIGHGTRLVEDMVVHDGRVLSLGPLAQYVLDHRVPLEVCLSSNVHTGATPSLEQHPFPRFWEKGFRVTLNTDNRLMSRTTMTDEYLLASQQFGLSLADLEKLAINGAKSAFAHHDERLRVIFERIKPGYERLRTNPGST
jgi:adenosine deaminase